LHFITPPYDTFLAKKNPREVFSRGFGVLVFSLWSEFQALAPEHCKVPEHKHANKCEVVDHVNRLYSTRS